jgi:Mg-chelatase subunit ChlD
MSTPAPIPDEFLCPISYEVMEDPVILEDGHTYDRKSIEAWLVQRRTSPLTNRALSSMTLNPNYALRAAIERWRGEAADASTVATPPMSSTPLFFHAGAAEAVGISAAADAAPLPTAVIAVLDRSGSMGESAAPVSQRSSEAALFSRMDLVKHSMRTVAGLLATRQASMGIVSFSDSADTNMTVKAMDATGKGGAERAIDALRPGGGTNIWAGLRTGLEQAAAWGAAHPGSNVHVILLTDGEPTSDYLPLQGIPTALKRKLATLKAAVTLSCFGFGYNLDTKLLEAICVEGGGTYGYIPDCSMVGTVFINYCAAALTTVAAHVPGAGAVQAGQRKIAAIGNVDAATFKGGAGEALTTEEEVRARRIVQLRTALAAATCSKTFAAIHAGGLQTLAEELRVGEAHLTPFEAALLDDLDNVDDYKGQILKAVSSAKYFSSWGLNYLLSYSRALACQQCVNFKDGALQFFAGDAFKAIQEEGNDIFDNLPAPVPSLSGSSYGSGSFVGGGYPMVSTICLNMGIFNNAGGTCWDQWALIRMEDGGHKPMKNIVAGERVWGGHRIRAVVKTVVNARVPMVRMGGKRGGVLITPWHPVRQVAGQVAGSWQFPAEVEEFTVTEELMNFYYNMVLESGHIVQFASEAGKGVWEACTLGHGFTEGPVITHPYFGTEAVVRDLEAARGWSEGLVLLNAAKHVRRDAATGLVCGLGSV